MHHILGCWDVNIFFNLLVVLLITVTHQCCFNTYWYKILTQMLELFCAYMQFLWCSLPRLCFFFSQRVLVRCCSMLSLASCSYWSMTILTWNTLTLNLCPSVSYYTYIDEWWLLKWFMVIQFYYGIATVCGFVPSICHVILKCSIYYFFAIVNWRW